MSGIPNHPTSETKNKIAKLDSEILCNQVNTIIGNPGFPGINQNILFCLDHKSQMAYRQVCHSWKKEVDQPIFWIKKLNLKSHPKELGNIWIDLVGRIQKGSDLEKEVTECLIKWYGEHQSWYDDSDYVNVFDHEGWTPLHIASQYGRTEIFKFLAPQVANPNAPAPNGLTPLQIATNNNHTEIVEIVSQMLAN